MEFLIRMKNGFLFSQLKGFQIMVTDKESEAFHFRSRMAALEIMATTHDFEGSAIVEAQPVPASS